MGSGQKLCREEILISPASTASMMPGRRLTRMPWLNSAHSNPRERISSSMARPLLWRWEFQHVEKEYMAVKKNAGRGLQPHSAARIYGTSHIGIAGAQHGGKTGRLHFAALAL